MGRDDKKRKAERKVRNKHHRDRLLDHAGGNDHWRGGVTFQLGKDPRARLDLVWSGVKVPIEPTATNHMDGVAEVTASTLKGGDGDVN